MVFGDENFDLISFAHQSSIFLGVDLPIRGLAKSEANPQTAGARCALGPSDWLFQRRSNILVFQRLQNKASHAFSPALVDGFTAARLDEAHIAGFTQVVPTVVPGGSELPYRRDASRGVALQWTSGEKPQGATRFSGERYAKSTWSKKVHHSFEIDFSHMGQTARIVATGKRPKRSALSRYADSGSSAGHERRLFLRQEASRS